MSYDLEYVNGISVSVKININCVKQIRTLIVAMLIRIIKKERIIL